MLDQYLKNCRDNITALIKSFQSTTLIVEIIHPLTRVLTSYEKTEFILLGINDISTLEEWEYRSDEFSVADVAKGFGFGQAEKWCGDSIDDLRTLMKDKSIQNQEGYVVRFQNGLRVKFKFENYIAKMVESKLSYVYLMRVFMSGRLEQMISLLPEEIHNVALKMLGEIMLGLSTKGSPQYKWQRLYKLVSADLATEYFKATCREFVKNIDIKQA